MAWTGEEVTPEAVIAWTVKEAMTDVEALIVLEETTDKEETSTIDMVIDLVVMVINNSINLIVTNSMDPEEITSAAQEEIILTAKDLTEINSEMVNLVVMEEINSDNITISLMINLAEETDSEDSVVLDLVLDQEVVQANMEDLLVKEVLMDLTNNANTEEILSLSKTILA